MTTENDKILVIFLFLGVILAAIIILHDVLFGIIVGWFAFITIGLIYFKVLESTTPEETKYFNRGMYYAKEKDCDKAIDCFNKVLEINPDNKAAKDNKSRILYHEALNLKSINYTDKALDYLNQALYIEPNSFEFIKKKAEFLFELRNFQDALNCADKSLNIKPNSEEVWQLKGQIFSRIGDYEDSISSFEKALEIDPNNVTLQDEKLEIIELYDKENEIRSSEHFFIIQNFASKYKSSDSNVYEKNLDKLRKLLEFKGIEVNKAQLDKIIQKEIVIQEYENFKTKLCYNNPETRKDYIVNLIEIYGESYEKYFDLLIQLLDEKSLSTDIDDILCIVKEIKDEKQLQRFEEELKSPKQFITLEDIDKFSGYEFEEFLKNLFVKMGYIAKNTSLSGDQGADLIIEKFGEKTVVQAKRYAEKVGNKAIQEVVASIAHYNAKKGIVVTNCVFTNSAIELANSNNVNLIDRTKLHELIQKYPVNK